MDFKEVVSTRKYCIWTDECYSRLNIFDTMTIAKAISGHNRVLNRAHGDSTRSRYLAIEHTTL